MIAYLDSSALVKMVVPEAGTEFVRRAWNRASERAASMLGYTDLRAATAAARRAGRIPAADLPHVPGHIEHLWSRLAIVSLDERLVRDAGALAERHGLRALDAIHLASAQRIASGPTAFVAFDARLREAAAAEGLIVLPEPA